MKKVEICFVILHYKTIKDTENCINSIQKLNNSLNEIVVVDNGSNNGTGEQLCEEYFENSNIHILLLKDNLGFSKGNNYGYEYARNTFDADFMIICNSDIIFTQRDLLARLKASYEKKPFYVLGPDIYIPRLDFHSNPLRKDIETNSELLKILNQKKHELKNINFFCFKRQIANKIQTVKTAIKYLVRYKHHVSKYTEDVVLQGACYIVSSEFIGREKLFFYPMNSFYYEEYFLYRKCKELNYKLVFDPDIEVLHLSGSATSNNYNTIKSRSEFILSNQIESLSKFIGSETIY